MRKIFGILVLMLIVGVSSSAFANGEPQVGDCDGWSTAQSISWVHQGIYIEISVTLFSVENFVSTEIESQTEGHWVPPNTWARFGDQWSTSPLPAGSYRVAFTTSYYWDLPAPPTEEELAGMTPGIQWTEDWFPKFDCEDRDYDGVGRTPGYWKNHAASWPVDELDLGGVTYDQACLLNYFRAPTRGDARVKLIHHLIAAKLNLLPNPIPTVGNVDPNTVTDYPDAGSTVSDSIAEGDAFLADTGTTILCPAAALGGSKGNKHEANDIKDALDAFNNNFDIDTQSNALMADEQGGCTAVGSSGAEAFGLPLILLAVLGYRRRRR